MNQQTLAPPTYQRIADDLASLIASEQIRPGEHLPSVRLLARQQGLGGEWSIPGAGGSAPLHSSLACAS